jgi:hypothetical protein
MRIQENDTLLMVIAAVGSCWDIRQLMGVENVVSMKTLLDPLGNTAQLGSLVCSPWLMNLVTIAVCRCRLMADFCLLLSNCAFLCVLLQHLTLGMT